MLQRIIFFLAFVTLSHAFAPSSKPLANTSLNMGLFDGFQPKKKAATKSTGGFLDGRGARITIREDEDNARWVEEPDTKKKGKKGGK